MSYSSILLLITATSSAVNSFTTHSNNVLRRSVRPATPNFAHVSFKTACFGTVRPDASDAIADAFRLSEEFGASSSEARVAWDIVEEMDSGSSALHAGNDPSNTIDAPQDYYDQIHSLSFLLKETNSKLAQMKQLVTNIKELELKDPSLSRLSDDERDEGAAALQVALANAKAAIDVYGPSSVESKEAWDKLEFCFGENSGSFGFSDECDLQDSSAAYRYSAAALKAHHYYEAAVDTALLQESLDAIASIEGLAKFVSIEKRRLDGRNNSMGP